MEMMKYILTAAGVIFTVGMVALLFKRKLPLRWGISLTVCGLILSAAGGVWIRGEHQQKIENYGSVYLALRYLEGNATEEAALYLRRSNLQDDYHLLTAQTLLEQMRGNETMARVRLDILQKMNGLNTAEEDGVDALRTWTPERESDAITILKEQMPLSQKELDALDARFDVEQGVRSAENQDGPGNEAENLRWQIDQAVGRQQFEDALDKATQLVDLSGTASDRLLLASVVAEVTYFNSEMTTAQFASHVSGGADSKDTCAEEAEELTNEYERLRRKLDVLQLDMQSADEAQAAELAEKERTLSQQVEEAQLRAENVFAYRALNSIVDIHSLKAQVVRAKLYFAVRNYQQAIDMLCETADSVQAAFSPDKNLTSSLKMVQKAYAAENTVGADSSEFQNEMLVLMGSVHPELLHLGTSSLSKAFTQRIVEDQKRYSDALYVTELDQSAYPVVRVRLGGQEKVIDRIAEQNKITLSDTRTAVSSYQVEKQTGSQTQNSICFVVDTSGSMDGAPLQDAKNALTRFLENTELRTQMTLVHFEDSADTLVDLTMDVNEIKTGVNAMGIGGGTNISAGIREGTQALENATGTRTMLLMTDGQSEIDMNAVQEAIEKQISIFTIGFGDVNDELLAQIAELCGGQYLRADDSAELASVYNSLQSVIGNTVTITYTVGTPETSTRYFYLQDGSTGLSVRKEYSRDVTSAAGEADTAAVQADNVPVFQTREILDSLLQRQEPAFWAQISGSGLDQVTGVRLAGMNCLISGQTGERLDLDVPTTVGDGVHDLQLTTAGGESVVLKKWLWVGNEVNWHNYQAGDLSIGAGRAMKLPDGRLVLGQGVSLRDNVRAEATRVNTLSVQLDGVLVVSAPALPSNTATGVTQPIALGDTGSAALHGILRVNGGDRAYDGQGNVAIFSGAMTLHYAPTENTITPEEETV